mmetsp:Transcript_28240/g.61823  ORF Transcript_28240/g.61823 Transcript_28240/m.61823 type:complete len:210 (-) Transcript_28240:37-666(-)
MRRARAQRRRGVPAAYAALPRRHAARRRAAPHGAAHAHPREASTQDLRPASAGRAAAALARAAVGAPRHQACQRAARRRRRAGADGLWLGGGGAQEGVVANGGAAAAGGGGAELLDAVPRAGALRRAIRRRHRRADGRLLPRRDALRDGVLLLAVRVHLPGGDAARGGVQPPARHRRRALADDAPLLVRLRRARRGDARRRSEAAAVRA